MAHGAAAGGLEYHGEHMAVSMDTLAVVGILDILEKEMNLVILPDEKMADYYARRSVGDDPLNWIKAQPLLSPRAMAGYPLEHAGRGETSLLMALFPEGVDLLKVSDSKW